MRLSNSAGLVRALSKFTFVGLLLGISAAAHATAVDRLQDSFGGTTIGSAWTVTRTAGNVTESGGTLNLTPNANTGTTSLLVKSAATYSLTGSHAAVQVPRVPNTGNVDAQFSLFLNASNYVQWFYQSGFLYAFKFVGGTKTQLAKLTYSSATHAWWRIRESYGQMYWETSSDGAVYTQRASVATSTLFSIAALNVNFYVETFSTGSASPGQASFANLNVVPSGIQSMSSLVDALGGTSLAAAWTLRTQTQGTVTEGGGTLNLTPNANTGSSQLIVASARPYALTGAGAMVQVKQVVSAAGSVNNRLSVQADDSNRLEWWFESGTLNAFYTVNSTRTTAAQLTYDPVQHAWWRIRESSGSVSFETSPDGLSWVSRAMVSDTALFPLSMAFVEFYLETFNSGSAAPGAAKYANFNTGRNLVVTGLPSSVTAGANNALVVEIQDPFGNRVTDYTGTIRFSSSDPSATVPSPYTFTSTDQGHRSFSGVVLRAAGTQTVLVGDGGSLTTSASTSVTPAVASALSLGGMPAASVAGDSLQATVTALDAYGNIATSYTGTVHFTSSDPRATLPADRAFLPGDLGRVNVSGVFLATSGSQSVTAEDTLTPSLLGSQSGIVVGPAAAASLSASGFPASTSAGQAGALTITAYDVYGNLATGYRGTVSFSSSDAQASLPAPTTYTGADAGSRSFALTLKTAGQQSISVTDGIFTPAPVNVSVTPGSAAQFVMSGIPATVPSRQPASLTLEVRDAWSNRATGYGGTVSFSSSDSQATLPPPYAFTPADAGIHTFANGITFVTSGAQSITASDGSISATQGGIIVTDTAAPTWPLGSRLTAVATSMSTAHLTWTAATDNVAVTAYRLYRNGTLDQTLSRASLSADVGGLTVGVSTSFQLQAGDAAGNWSSDGPIASVIPTPPDPVLIAPPLDATVSTTIGTATAFLYTGPNAIQTGVAPGTISATRVAVVRGLVRDRASQPLAGVKISILNHAEYGNTWSRADGRYDLAVNGGSALTLKYERSDFLGAQRNTPLKWQDYTEMPDVVMVPYDGLTTLLSSGSSQTQVVRGSVSVDDIGQRQATVVVPPGTSATMVMSDGSTQSLSAFHVRATELTVGADGPRAMPGPLPSMSAYTYAVAFTADEAVAAGASHVQFSQPVYGYVENFLAFPVGMTMPNGSYDTVNGRWVAEGNGRVIQILSVEGGFATVDTNGDGQPDDAATLAALGISNSELATLGSLYAAGQTLWRVPMLHFSWEDWNVGLGMPPGAAPPPPPTIDVPAPPPPDPPACTGCRIDVLGQTLGEEVPIVGTPYSLHYRSDRVPGRRAAYRINLTVPAALSFRVPAGTSTCLPNRTPECQPANSNTIPVPATLTVRVAGRTGRHDRGLLQLSWDQLRHARPGGRLVRSAIHRRFDDGISLGRPVLAGV